MKTTSLRDTKHLPMMASCLILTPARIWAHDYREEEQRKGAVFTGKLPSGGGNSSWIFCRTGRT